MQTNAFKKPVRMPDSNRFRSLLLILFCYGVLAGCGAQTAGKANVQTSVPGGTTGSMTADANKFLIVDCLLPGQIRKLGRSMTYLSPRQAVKTSALECEIRGGEYIAYDRSNMATSLNFWLPQAKEGDKVAQTYVGEIYEKGMGVQPDYQLAAQWYEKAAGQNYARAEINLGYLYERGLGVPKDPVKALNLYRQASGIQQPLSIGPTPLADKERTELKGLREEVERQKGETQMLQKQLNQTRRELEKARREQQQRRDRVEMEESQLEKARKDYESVKQKALGPNYAEVQKREEEIQRREAQMAKERQEIERKRQELAQSGGVRKDPAKELEKTQKQLQERKAAIEAERKRLEQERQEFEQQKQKVAQGTPPELKAQKEALSSREEEIARLRDEVEQQKDQIAKLERSGQSPLEDFNKLHHQLEQREATLQSERDKLTQERQQFERRQQELALKSTPELESKQQALKQREEEISRLRQEMEAQRQEMARLESASKGPAEDFEKLKKQLEERKAAAEAERGRLERERQQLEKEKQQLAQTFTPELEQKEQALKQREQEVAKLRSELDQHRDKIVQLEEAVSKSDIIVTPKDILPVEPVASPGSGPVIEILDPQLVLTRGVRIAPTHASAASKVVVGKVTAPAGLMTLTINDQQEQVDANGLFRVGVPVMRSAETQVKIVAIDKVGGRAAVEFALVQDKSQAGNAVVGPETSEGTTEQNKLPPIDFGQYYALVIGNNNYAHLPKLDTAVNDAQKVGAVLNSKYGFKTTVLSNATRYDILAALNNLRKQLTEKDNLLIYYAGHGDLDKTNLRGYWLPLDAEPGNTANWVSVVDITDILNAMSARHVLVIADSCYSGVMTRSALTRLEAGMSEEARNNWFQVMAEKRSRTVLTSGGMQPVLDAGGGDHSVFAKALLQVLSKNNEILDGQRLGREVSTLVSYAAKAYVLEQVPEYAPIRYAGHESGDFFFVPKT